MHKPLSDKLSALLTTAMREAIRSRRLDPARVPFKVHVAERAVGGTVFLGVSFPTLHPRAQIRSTFWGAVARLPFGVRTCSSFERSYDVPVVLPGAEDVAAFDAHAVLRTLLGEEHHGALTVEDVHLLLGTYAVEERRFGAFADKAYGQGAEGTNYWTVTIPKAKGGTMAALLGARYGSEAAARKAVAARCERLLADVDLARVG